MAAAGLWTTPRELSLAVIAMMKAHRGEHHRSFVSPASARAMLQPVSGQWRLGFQLSSEGGRKAFMHGGETEGFVSYFAAVPGSCQGAVVMTNANSGEGLVKEVLRGIADTHGWPELWPTRMLRQLQSDQIASFVGSYRVKEPAMVIELRATTLGLGFFLNGKPQGRLLKADEQKFVLLTPSNSILAQVSFASDAAVAQPRLSIEIGDRHYEAERVTTSGGSL